MSSTTTRRLNGFVRTIAILATLSSLVLGSFAASTLFGDRLFGQQPADAQAGGEDVLAAGEGGGGAEAPVHSPVTVPVAAVPPAPVAPAPVGVTPGKNPPLMAVGSSGVEVRELQARLAQLDHFDATVTGYFGEVTRGALVDYQASIGAESSGELYPEVWTSLQGATDEPTEEELYPPPPVAEPPTVNPAGLDSRCLTGRAMCVDKSKNQLVWVVDGRPQLQLDARFGSDELPTREGQFSVYRKSRDHVSSLYHTPMPFAMFFSGGQAVHYSPDFAATGYSGASHGCVNLRDRAAVEWLYDQVQYGDKVVVYWS